MVERASDGFYHPSSEEEVIELIAKARAEGLKLRVRGAGHSEPQAIAEPSCMVLLLDRMSGVSFDDANTQVTVQAGCHLGYDPKDPSGASSRHNGLFQQLDRHGWAVPDMGGISRQTVAGFLSTGSSGGSLQHSPSELIVKIRLIDGTGAVHDFNRSDDPDDPFYAAGVSMGLLGVVTAVTLQCVPRYLVEGVERTSDYASCEIDLFGGGSERRRSLEGFFREAEHSRLLWWPQTGVNKMTVWRAEKRPMQAGFKPKPYQQVRKLLGSSLPAYLLINACFRLLDPLNPPGPRGWLARNAEGALGLLYKLIAGSILKPSEQHFFDIWWRALPMDDGTNYDLLPTSFTEIWLPIEKTQEVMRRLRNHYETRGYPATGIYSCELYASPASKFWMSPAYGREVLKVDMFWFKQSKSDPLRDFYPQFWQLFRDLDYTLHWAKALDDDVVYLKRQYPRWDDFMSLRARMDPDQVFLTDYWRQHLGIAA